MAQQATPRSTVQPPLNPATRRGLLEGQNLLLLVDCDWSRCCLRCCWLQCALWRWQMKCRWICSAACTATHSSLDARHRALRHLSLPRCSLTVSPCAAIHNPTALYHTAYRDSIVPNIQIGTSLIFASITCCLTNRCLTRSLPH